MRVGCASLNDSFGARFFRKIASGYDHIALLTADGQLYTLGAGEQGQLGRVGERFTFRGGRRGLSLLLQPDRVHAKNRRICFANVWAGSCNTYALTMDGDVLACGLNNYYQLGVPEGLLHFTLVKSDSFSRLNCEAGLDKIVAGQHHAIATDKKGRAYAVGRAEYGRLGLGENVKADAIEPVAISGLHTTLYVFSTFLHFQAHRCHLPSSLLVKFSAGARGTQNSSVTLTVMMPGCLQRWWERTWRLGRSSLPLEEDSTPSCWQRTNRTRRKTMLLFF